MYYKVSSADGFTLMSHAIMEPAKLQWKLMVELTRQSHSKGMELVQFILKMARKYLTTPLKILTII